MFGNQTPSQSIRSKHRISALPGARAADAGDLEHLAHLLALNAEAGLQSRGGKYFGIQARLINPKQRLQSAIDDPESLVVTGTFDNVPVGVALATSSDSLVMIEELYVEREAREVGVGEALLDAVVEWAQEQNMAAIDYPALPGDRATKSLGERSGFSARLIVMHRRL